MISITRYQSNDGEVWTNETDALERDALIARLTPIAALLPDAPKNSNQRIPIGAETLIAAKTAVIELCRELYPNEAVFKHPPMEIHPMSYAGRFLSEVGGPINKIWWKFSCINDGWMYQQPYYALHPEEFVPPPSPDGAPKA